MIFSMHHHHHDELCHPRHHHCHSPAIVDRRPQSINPCRLTPSSSYSLLYSQHRLVVHLRVYVCLGEELVAVGPIRLITTVVVFVCVCVCVCVCACERATASGSRRGYVPVAV
eukprot:GHVU01211868.1.p1 GENE.GHVU01211868.1~~GHVU01211868.1.p1  ORF type:complete len:113 (+),score=3.53 GHVU01211868.1:805-1143(+)